MKEAEAKTGAELAVERHPGPFIGPDVELARAIAMAVIPWYGNDDGPTHERIMKGGIWNDHIAVQAALAAIHHLRAAALPGAAGPDAVREATIEECAKIADQTASRCIREQAVGDKASRFIAQQIRALSTQPVQDEGRPATLSRPEPRCQKCGVATEGEEALVDGQIWCHPCADAVTLPSQQRSQGE